MSRLEPTLDAVDVLRAVDGAENRSRGGWSATRVRQRMLLMNAAWEQIAGHLPLVADLGRIG
jgi:hypothetical protein